MNKTQIRKALSECAFDPRKPGPLKVMADVNDVNYYLNRAIESISAAKNQLYSKDSAWGLANIDIAISLLALSKVKLCTKK